eukprot:NODE_13753_length_240_cov_1.059459.p4 GENE.NODE_13753_length_240_cov_1.059459~~NODE_13753_length_240_cov_1.059459.p4  ORF type:complete len:67 (-),score=22.04 NODE_13753_length_240_cov_1.059459:40-219(-)
MLSIGGDQGAGKARSIVFQECLFRHAAGCVEQAERKQVAARIGGEQFAVGPHPGTAPLV